MKKILTLLPLIACYFASCSKTAKEKDVPAAVKTKLNSLYPGTSNVKWSKEGGKFEAEFNLKEGNTSVLIDADGNLTQTETEIAVSSLPQAMLDYVSKTLSGKNIKEAAKIVDATGTVTYEAEAGGFDNLFDVNGNFIKRESDDEDDDEDDD